MKTTAELDDMYRIIHTDHHDPFSVLGARAATIAGKPCVVIRAFLPDAANAFVVDRRTDAILEMDRVHQEGFFELVVKKEKEVFPYRLRKRLSDGQEEEFEDSYSFLPTLTDFDLYLFNSGDHRRVYEKLGAHHAEINGVGGVQFAVWAPNARSVSVIGDFNHWDRRKHAMRVLGTSGVWEIFVPGLPEGALYKFQVKTQSGFIMDKTDPYGTEMENRPRTASKVNFLRRYEWNDEKWLQHRRESDHLGEPISVYEVHLSSWRRKPEEGNRWLTYREMAHELVDYVKDLGYTHIELMPVMEHPLDASWGYQVTGYYAPTSRFGRPDDFKYFVDHCHENGIGVILDWVPAHFPKDAHALGTFDGTHLYEHSDPRRGEHQDWGTYIFNYGRKEVRNFLIGNALFWIEEYHIDGLRIDAVASMLYLDYSRKEGEWIPNEYGGRENLDAIQFLKDMNDLIHQFDPGVLTIAEESTAWPGVTSSILHGGLGFSLKWNMGWMHDMLVYYSKDPIYRSFNHEKLTFALLYAFTERFMLPLSHDEVVHGKASMLSKMPGDHWQKRANLRLLYGLQYGFPGKKLLFMGSEFGQWKEWDHDQSLDWHMLGFDEHRGIQQCVKDLNRIYKDQPALHQVDFHYSGFEWIDFKDAASSVITFLRRSNDEKEAVIVACNFTPIPRFGYRLGVPEQGQYREIFNTDSEYYGGSNIGNAGAVQSDRFAFHGRPFSVMVTLPPLGAVFFKKVSSPKA